MAGRIVCAPDGTWHRTRPGRDGAAYDAFIGDPVAQVQRNIFALRRALRRCLPDFVRRTPLWIEGLIVFPHSKTELETDASRVPAVLLSDVGVRISTHVPRRRLQPQEVDTLVGALLAEAQPRRLTPVRQTAQALVELALVLPVVLLLVFGTIGVSRYVQTSVAVIAVAHEAARAGALARSPSDAVDRMRQRAASVAPGPRTHSRGPAAALGCDAFQQQSRRGRSDHRLSARLRGFAHRRRPLPNRRARRTRRVGGSIPQRHRGGRSCCGRDTVTSGVRTVVERRWVGQALVWLTLAVPLFVSVSRSGR